MNEFPSTLKRPWFHGELSDSRKAGALASTFMSFTQTCVRLGIVCKSKLEDTESSVPEVLGPALSLGYGFSPLRSKHC